MVHDWQRPGGMVLGRLIRHAKSVSFLDSCAGLATLKGGLRLAGTSAERRRYATNFPRDRQTRGAAWGQIRREAGRSRSAAHFDWCKQSTFWDDRPTLVVRLTDNETTFQAD